MIGTRGVFPFALALPLAAALAPAARADNASDADALFEQGMTDLAAHQVEKACTELAASQAKRADIATQAALADCYTQLGKTASAWRLWHELATSAPAAGLRAEAASNATKLESRVPHVTVVLPASAPASIVVMVDGTPIDSHGSPIAVDPGAVDVTATATGFQPMSRHEQVTEGQALTITLGDLAPIEGGAGPTVPVREPVRTDVMPPPAPRDRPVHYEARVAYSVLGASFSSATGDGYTNGGATVAPDPGMGAIEIGGLALVAPTAWLRLGGGLAYRHLGVNFHCEDQDVSNNCISNLASHGLAVPLVVRGVRRFGDWEGSVSVAGTVGVRTVSWHAVRLADGPSEASFSDSPQLAADVAARVGLYRAVGTLHIFLDVGYEHSLKAVVFDGVSLSYGGLAIGAGITY